jgi:hypothetical protein
MIISTNLSISLTRKYLNHLFAPIIIFSVLLILNNWSIYNYIKLKIKILYIIVTKKKLAWLIIVRSKFDDWVYWTSSITITLDYKSSHTELLPNDVCLLSRCLVTLQVLNPQPSNIESDSESYVTTVGQPAILSWNKAPNWGLRPDSYYCLTVACLPSPAQSYSGPIPVGLMTIFLSQIREFPFRRLLTLQGSSWRYSTPPTHEFALHLILSVSLMLRPSVSRPVCPGKSTHLGLTTRSWLLSDSCAFVDKGRSLWRESESVVCNCYWASPAQSFSGPSPSGLATIFCSLRFHTSIFRRFLRLAELPWRYSTTPSHGISPIFTNPLPFVKWRRN